MNSVGAFDLDGSKDERIQIAIRGQEASIVRSAPFAYSDVRVVRNCV